MTIRVLGIIPARGGSKGIPRKNIIPLAGKPLIAWSIEAARQSCLERVVLSSDDAEIIAVARETGGVEVPFVRPPELATDTAAGIDVVLHAVEWLQHHEGYHPDAVMLLQPTSPLRRAEHINAAVAQFVAQGADSLVSVVAAPHSMIPESLMRLNAAGWLEPVVPFDERRLSRQQKPRYYARNGAAIYLVQTALLLERRTLYGERLAAYTMRREDSIDIDDAFDVQLCEWLLTQRRAGET